MNINVEKSEIVIDPSEKIKPEKKERKKPNTCPLKSSTFFLTINTNFCTVTCSEQEYKEFKTKFEFLMNDFLKRLDQFIIFKTSKMGLGYGYSLDDPKEVLIKPDRIVENQVEYVLENSPNRNLLHSHSIIFLKKRGVDTKLDLAAIREHFKQQIGHPVYCNYQLESKRGSLKDYVRKNPLD